jgi:hypothetical protein
VSGCLRSPLIGVCDRHHSGPSPCRPLAAFHHPGLSRSNPHGFVVRDHSGQQLAYVFFEDERGLDRRRNCSEASANDVPSRLSIITPAPTLGFCNPGTASLGLRTRRQSAVQAAARFAELNPHPTRPARSGFGQQCFICSEVPLLLVIPESRFCGARTRDFETRKNRRPANPETRARIITPTIGGSRGQARSGLAHSMRARSSWILVAFEFII